MGTRRISAAAVAVLTGITGLTVGAADPASADAAQVLSIESFGDIVVDGVHERVFISDPAEGKVIATDYSGNQLGTARVSDANNLALASDSSRLYVAAPGESAVFALDTTTLTQTAKYSTGAVAPKDLTVAGGRIWFSYANDVSSRLGTIDPSTETPTVLLNRYDTVSGVAKLDTASADPNRIGVLARGKIAVLDVSGDTVDEVAALNNNGDVVDMAIFPDGKQIAMVYPGNWGITVRGISDLFDTWGMFYEATPNAVDVAADGTIAGGSDLGAAPDLHLFTPSGELINEFRFPDSGRGVDRAVAWEPNGDRLFAIAANGSVFTFRSYEDTRHSPTTMALFGPSTAVVGVPITVTGKLRSSLPLAAGISIAVSRDGTSLGTVAAGPTGTFYFTDAPPTGGVVNYEFSYAGDGTHLASTATSTIQVSVAASTLTLAGPSSATRAKPLTITGTLASPLALSAGSTVSVTRADLDHPSGTSLGTRTVGSGGSFSITDTPTAGGPVTYRVSYAGDSTHTPAAAAKVVAVSRTTAALTLNNNGKVYAYGKTVSFTAHLGSTYKSRTVEIWADPNGTDQARRLLKRGTVNSSGNIATSIKLTRNTTLSAVFTGDSRTAPRTVTAAVGTRVSLSLKLSKYYKSAKISGKTYRYYHVGKSAWFTTSMTSASKRKAYVQLQRYTKGKWRAWDSGYFDATDSLYLDGSGLTGVKLRVRTAYVKGGSGDSLNTSTWAPYQYLTFTR